MYNLFTNVEMPLITTLSKMELSGIKVDKEILNNLGVELKKKIDEITSSIHDLAGEKFNILSPKQLGIILFEKLKLPYAKKNKKWLINS